MIPYAQNRSVFSPKPTPLTRASAAACRSNRWTAVNSWAAVEAYTDEAEDYDAFVSGAGVIDLSPLSRWRIGGPQAVDCIDRLTTVNAAQLDVGVAVDALLCDEHGKVVDLGRVYRVDAEICFLEMARTRAVRMRRAVTGFNAAAAELTENLGAMGVIGPAANAILEDLGFEVGRDELICQRRRLKGVDIVMLPLQLGAARGFELAFPADEGLTIWEAVFRGAKSADPKPAGLKALDILRIENGRPRLGADFSGAEEAEDLRETRTPFELGLGELAPLNTAWFNGRRALRELALRPRQTALISILIESDAVASGDVVRAGGRTVGRVTSWARAPHLRSAIAFAEVDAEAADGPFFEVEASLDPLKPRALKPARLYRSGDETGAATQSAA